MFFSEFSVFCSFHIWYLVFHSIIRAPFKYSSSASSLWRTTIIIILSEQFFVIIYLNILFCFVFSSTENWTDYSFSAFVREFQIFSYVVSLSTMNLWQNFHFIFFVYFTKLLLLFLGLYSAFVPPFMHCVL